MANQSAVEPATLELGAARYLDSGANSIPDHSDGIRAIVDLARQTQGVEIVSLPTTGLGNGLPPSVPIVIDRRDNREIKGLKRIIDEYRTEPGEVHGEAKVTTLQSFIDLVNRHKNEGSAVFGKTSWPEPALTAVIDYHGEKAAARWGHHRIRYAFPITDEFKIWIDRNSKPMAQSDFALFLEDHAAELAAATPEEKKEYEALFKETFATPADLLELSRHLEVFVNAKVKQGARIKTGERVVEFVEEHMNGKGEPVEIPGIFMVSVAAFVDGAPVRIPGRLRYRIAGGEIQWSYQLYRWQFWLRKQIQADLTEAAKQTELPTFEGSPEA
nr:DUF2303 family protein [Methylobacterium sp. ZNC0032]